MKINIKTNMVKYAVILLLILIAFFIGHCSRKDKSIKPNIVYLKDTTTHSGTSQVPIATNQNKPIVIWKTIDNSKTIHDTIDRPVIVIDSASCVAIAEDYYSTYSYDRVLVDDSLLTFTLHDTTFKNRIGASSYEYKINRPQTIVINKPKDKISVYGGVNAFYSKELGIMPTVSVQGNYKKFSVCAGVGNKCYTVGAHIKLF